MVAVREGCIGYKRGTTLFPRKNNTKDLLYVWRQTKFMSQSLRQMRHMEKYGKTQRFVLQLKIKVKPMVITGSM